MTKAFAYLRVSGKGQVEGDGFTRQLEAIRKYAKEQGIRIVRVFREEGVSGTKDLGDRPAFVEMMTALHADGVDLVLIEKLDRLARDQVVQELILRDLRKHGFDLIPVMEPDLVQDDPSNPTRTLIRQIMGAVAQYEKSLIVLKLRGARQRKRAKTGRCEGAKPYGSLPGETAVIERMKQLRASGLGFDRIATKLNAEAIRPRRGKQWWGLAVNKILSRSVGFQKAHT